MANFPTTPFPTLGQRHPVTGFINGKAWRYIGNYIWVLLPPAIPTFYIDPEFIEDSENPVSSAYLQSVFAGLQTNIANILIVSGVAGNDSEAVRTALNKPFKTIEAAKNAATSNDLIIVTPGTYPCDDILKNNVHYYCMPGVYLTGNVFATKTDNNYPINSKILGHAVIDATSRALYLRSVNNNSNIYLEADRIISNTSYAIRVETVQNLNLDVVCRKDINGYNIPVLVNGVVTGSIKVTAKDYVQVSPAGTNTMPPFYCETATGSDVDIEIKGDNVFKSAASNSAIVYQYGRGSRMVLDIKNKIVNNSSSWNSYSYSFDVKWGEFKFYGSLESSLIGLGYGYNGDPGIIEINGNIVSNSRALHLARPNATVIINGNIESIASDAVHILNAGTNLYINGKVKSQAVSGNGIYTNQATSNIYLEKAIFDTDGFAINSTVPLSVNVERTLHYKNAPNSNVTLLSDYESFPVSSDISDIPETFFQSDFNEEDTTVKEYIKNRPFIPGDLSELTDTTGLLFSGAYNDLSGKPSIPVDLSELTDTMGLLFSGNYNDLDNKPTLFSGVYNDLSGKPTLFSGAYGDLSGIPDMNSLTANWQANNLDANALRMRTGAVAGYYLRAADVNGNLEYAPIGASQVYMGTWNPTTNTPTLSDGTGTQGHWYRVIADGTINLGSGNIMFEDGDDVSHNGLVWEQVPGKDFTLVPATALELGGVKIGANINVTGDGTISVNLPDLTPYATQVWVDANYNNYVLQIHGNDKHSENYITAAALTGYATQTWVTENAYVLETHGNDKHSAHYITAAEAPVQPEDLFSGSYDDLMHKPSIPSDINQLSDTTNLLFSGIYADLEGKPSLVTLLGQLDNVEIDTPINNHVLTYDSTRGSWINKTVPPPTNITLGSLVNVTIDHLIANRHGLFYELSTGLWKNRAITIDDLPGIPHSSLTGINANQHIDWTNTSSNLLTTGILTARGFRTEANNNTFHLFGRSGTSQPTSYFTRNLSGDFIRCLQGSIGTIGTNVFSVDYSGNVNAAGNFTGVNFIHSSDRRVKNNIEYFTDNITKLFIDYTSFEHKSDPGTKRFGVIAQDLLDAGYREFVRTDRAGNYSVAYNDLFAYEIAWLKQQINKLTMIISK